MPRVGLVVAIPVCNERLHIEACLLSLNEQLRPACGLGVLLFLNNCTDGTVEAIAAAAPAMTFQIRVIVCNDPAASAGWARRRAMNAAAAWLEEGSDEGVLLTTDADSRVPPDWLTRNLNAIAGGAHAVAGRLALDPRDAVSLPPALHARGALEGEYEALLTEIAARLDPLPHDPWPHHWCRSGASLATRLSTYRAVGGMPNIPCGEDRAFIEAVLAHDLAVRHDPDLVIVTSARLQGRAKGGVADTIKQRIEAPDSVCDERLENVERVVGRALLRRRLRRLHDAGQRGAVYRWVRLLGVNEEAATCIAELGAFGAIHAALEAASPHLTYRPLRPTALPRQIGRARLLATILRRTAGGTRMAGSAPTTAVAADRAGVVAACD